MLGSDFESFLTSDGLVIPETILDLPGKKVVPVSLSDEYGPAGFLHRDNVMLEMCSLPSSTAEEFVRNVQRALKAGDTWLKKRDPKLGISAKAAHIFNPDQLTGPQGQELGCDEDFISNNFLSQERERMTAEMIGNSRFSGAHVHISYGEGDDAHIPAWIAACLCDLFIGLPNASSLDKERAVYYGNLTLHRPTKYPDGSLGVEYRPLDNFWVHDEQKCLAVAEGAQKVEQLLNLGDQDVIRELHMIHTELPAVPLLCDLADDAATKYHVSRARWVWQEACEL